MRSPLLTLIVFAAVSLSSAATLRVPEEFTTLQRAIHAAKWGDTIVIAPGEYPGGMFIRKPLTIRGSGTEKTKITRKEDDLLISVDNYGPVVLSDFSIGYPPEVSGRSFGIEAREADITLRNIAITNAGGYGINSSFNAVVIENVTIAGGSAYGLSLDYTKPGVKVDGLSMDKSVSSIPLSLTRVIGTFRNVKVVMPDHAEIQVWGQGSGVKFENFPPEHFSKIRWLDGAAADGPKNYEPDAYESGKVAEHEQIRTFLKEELAANKALDEKRADATRTYQKALLGASSKEEHGKALAAYIAALFEIAGPPPEYGDTDDPALKHEFRVFAQLYGGKSMAELLPNLPPRQEGQAPADYYQYAVPPDVQEQITKANAATTVASSINVEAEVSKWTAADTKNPAAAAQAFANVIRTLTEKSSTFNEPQKQVLKARLREEFKAFFAKCGVEGFDELFTQLAARSSDLITREELRDSLDAQQKKAYTKFLMSK